jgi:hypothetical protein
LKHKAANRLSNDMWRKKIHQSHLKLLYCYRNFLSPTNHLHFFLLLEQTFNNIDIHLNQEEEEGTVVEMPYVRIVNTVHLEQQQSNYYKEKLGARSKPNTTCSNWEQQQTNYYELIYSWDILPPIDRHRYYSSL